MLPKSDNMLPKSDSMQPNVTVCCHKVTVCCQNNNSKHPPRNRGLPDSYLGKSKMIYWAFGPPHTQSGPIEISEPSGLIRHFQRTIGASRGQSGQVGSNRVQSGQVRSSQVQLGPVGSSRVQSDPVVSSRIQSDQVRSFRIQSDQKKATKFWTMSCPKLRDPPPP